MNEHKWEFTTNDPGLDGMQFIWIGGKRLFAVGEEYVIIPSSYYDRVTGFINNKNGPQVWHAGDPDLFAKLERFINDCS
jgi:hypothetical protein